MRYAICNETYQGWSLERVCADVADAGYDGLEIAPFTLMEPVQAIDESVGERAGRIVREAGLDPIGLHWLLSKTEGFHLTSPERAVRKATVEFASRLTRCCAAMGGHVMVWGSPPQRTYPDHQSYDDAMSCAVEVLQQVCETAGKLGVTLAMEPLARKETNFLNTAKETASLIERVNHTACRLHLDVKAMSEEQKPIPQIIREQAHYLTHFHANDPNLRGPGMGEVAFEPIFAALQDVKYDGYISVEVFDYKPDGPTIARQSLAYLRESEEKMCSA